MILNNLDEISDMFSDLFRKNKITETQIQERLDICKECTNKYRLTKTTLICKSCGCVMNLKVTFSRSKCPIGKWKEV
jgi:hypothetical protein